MTLVTVVEWGRPNENLAPPSRDLRTAGTIPPPGWGGTGELANVARRRREVELGDNAKPSAIAARGEGEERVHAPQIPFGHLRRRVALAERGASDPGRDLPDGGLVEVAERVEARIT